MSVHVWACVSVRGCVGWGIRLGIQLVISEMTCRKRTSTRVWEGGSTVLACSGRGVLDCRVTQLSSTLSPLLLYGQLRSPLPDTELHPSARPPKAIHSSRSITCRVALLKKIQRGEKGFTSHVTANCLKLLEKFFKCYIEKFSSSHILRGHTATKRNRGGALGGGTSPPKHRPSANLWAEPKGPLSKRTQLPRLPFKPPKHVKKASLSLH